MQKHKYFQLKFLFKLIKIHIYYIYNEIVKTHIFAHTLEKNWEYIELIDYVIELN